MCICHSSLWNETYWSMYDNLNSCDIFFSWNEDTNSAQIWLMAKGIYMYLYYLRCCMCHGEESPKLMAKYGKDLFCCKSVQFPENKVIPWCSSSKQIMMVPASMYEHFFPEWLRPAKCTSTIITFLQQSHSLKENNMDLEQHWFRIYLDSPWGLLFLWEPTKLSKFHVGTSVSLPSTWWILSQQDSSCPLPKDTQLHEWGAELDLIGPAGLWFLGGYFYPNTDICLLSVYKSLHV